VNTLSFSAILSLRGKEGPMGSSSIKYFLIQSRASAVLIISTTIANSGVALALLVSVVFLTKMGAAPVHA